MNITKNGVRVLVGQVWRDLDKRMGHRFCKVIAVGNGFATMQRCSEGGFPVTDRVTRVSIQRMHEHSTGWRLV